MINPPNAPKTSGLHRALNAYLKTNRLEQERLEVEKLEQERLEAFKKRIIRALSQSSYDSSFGNPRVNGSEDSQPEYFVTCRKVPILGPANKKIL